MLNSTDFSYLFNYLPIILHNLGFRISSAVSLGFSCLVIMLKETLLTFGCNIYVVYRLVHWCHPKRRLWVSEEMDLWRAPPGISVTEPNCEKRQGSNSGSSFHTSSSSLLATWRIASSRKSVVKRLWEITVGEHSANIKSLKDYESSLLNEGAGKEGHCWSTTYRNTGATGSSQQFLAQWGHSYSPKSVKERDAPIQNHQRKWQLAWVWKADTPNNQAPQNTETQRGLCGAPTLQVVTRTWTLLSPLCVRAAPARSVWNGTGQWGVRHASAAAMCTLSHLTARTE